MTELLIMLTCCHILLSSNLIVHQYMDVFSQAFSFRISGPPQKRSGDQWIILVTSFLRLKDAQSAWLVINFTSKFICRQSLPGFASRMTQFYGESQKGDAPFIKLPHILNAVGSSVFNIHWSHCDYIQFQFICFCVCTCRVSRKSCYPNFKGYVGTPDFWAKVSQSGPKWFKLTQTIKDNLFDPK